MNDHLKLVFKILLPSFEKEGVNYWVYGGVAIAGVKGYFYRYNRDIDIFVIEKDYKKAIAIIKVIAGENLWRSKSPKLRNDRQKYELYINDVERLSMVPIYERGNNVEFIFESGSKKFVKELLKPVIRNIETYKFITPSEDLLKALLRYYLECFFKSERKRNNKKLWKKRQLDTEQLLGNKETKKLFIDSLASRPDKNN